MTPSVQDADFDVLVVGGGPTGLMAGCQLLRCGVRVRIIDRALEPLQAPKALSLWPRALDIFDDLGVGDEIRKESVQINAFSYFSNGRPLASFGFAPELASRTLPQPVTERVLTERLHTLGGRVERGVRLLGLDGIDFSDRIEATDGVTAILEHQDGRVERVRVPFVIGADGAGSTVRGLIGAAFQGSTYEMAFALVDARVAGELPPDQVLYYQNPDGTLVIVPAPDGVFRFLSVLPRGVREANVPMMQALVDERGPRGVRLTEPVWQTVFRVHARCATDFQRGRVFIMGDAAHVHSPAGGQGMNNGLQDAHNLAWKLASVIRGAAPASLLLTYGVERAEATRRIVRDTDLQTRAWMVNGRGRVFARDLMFRFLDRTGLVSRHYAPVMAGRRLAYSPVRDTQRPSRNLPGCGLWHRIPGGLKIGGVVPRRLAVSQQICGPDADPLGWTVAVVPPGEDTDWVRQVDRLTSDRPMIRVLSLPPRIAAEALNCRHPGYYLIRPDGHVAAHGHERDLGRLAAELDLALAPAGPAVPQAAAQLG
ncbi:MAG TPA: FAD-dependent monooxygenase [Micromonosporaceae bacterium]